MSKSENNQRETTKSAEPASEDIIRLPSLTWNEVPPEIQNFYRMYKDGQLKREGKIHWDGMIRFGDVFPFLESGCDLGVLGDLLKKEPMLISHPFVWVTLIDLHVLLASGPEKGYEQILEDSLKMILEPFIKGLLPTFDIKWMRKKEKRKRGRPSRGENKVSMDDRRTYTDYEITLVIIQEELPKEDLRRAEQKRTINNYLADGIRRIWKRWDPRILKTRIFEGGELGFLNGNFSHYPIRRSMNGSGTSVVSETSNCSFETNWPTEWLRSLPTPMNIPMSVIMPSKSASKKSENMIPRL